LRLISQNKREKTGNAGGTKEDTGAISTMPLVVLFFLPILQFWKFSET
jgi:hypothetical protein